jgi:hypothetical protein
MPFIAIPGFRCYVAEYPKTTLLPDHLHAESVVLLALERANEDLRTSAVHQLLDPQGTQLSDIHLWHSTWPRTYYPAHSRAGGGRG